MAVGVLAGRQAVSAAPYRTLHGLGAADDAPQIQAAIDAANAAYVADGIPRTVRLFGLFNLPQTAAIPLHINNAGADRRCAVAIRPGVTLLAQRDAVFKATQADVECFIAPLDSGVTFDEVPSRKTSGGDNWAVRGIVFDCNQTSGAEFNGGAISVGSSNDWEVTDCVFKRIRGDAMTIVVGSGQAPPCRWRFERNTVSQLAGQTILVDMNAASPITDVSITDNYVRDGTTTAETFVFNGSSATVVGKRIIFSRNRMYLTGTNVFAKCNDTVIEGNHLYQPSDSQGAGLDFSGDGITITGNIFDSSAAVAGGANHPFRCTATAANVTINNNVFRCGYAGCKATTGTNWTVSNNVIETVAGSTDAATAVALNLAGVTGATVVGNRVHGGGHFNCIAAGSDASIIGNWLDTNSYISAGARSRVNGNHVASAPANVGGQTFSAIGVGADSTVQANRATAGTTSGVVSVTGSRVVIQCNILENTYVGGYYYNGATAGVFVLDNMGIPTAAVGASGGGDGFNVGGAGSAERVL